MTENENNTALPAGKPAAGEPRSKCLLQPLDPNRGLSLTLVQYLGEEMEDIDFTLESDDRVTAVWLCGYEAGAVSAVLDVRRRFPGIVLLVTGRGPLEEWRDEVLEAGADRACAWPVPYAEVSRILTSTRARAAL